MANVTIKDIAYRLGVSTTTVTKALRGLPPISEETRRLVLSAAQEMGYRPNRSAQLLVGGGIRLAYIYASDSTEYQRYVERGIADVLRDLSDYRITIERYPLASIYDAAGMVQALEAIEKNPPDGLIMCPILRQEEYRPMVEEMIAHGLPVSFIVQEMDGVAGIGTLQADWYVIGKMAGQMMGLVLPEDSHVAVITTNKDFKAHIRSRQGFMDAIDPERITDVSVYENQDNREITYLITKEIIERRPDISGIYVTSYNSVRVCRCIEDHGLTGKYTVIGQDLYPELIECMDKKQLLATIFPNQYQIGYQAIKHMMDYLCRVGGKEDTVIMPQLVLASNLDCYRKLYQTYDSAGESLPLVDGTGAAGRPMAP